MYNILIIDDEIFTQPGERLYVFEAFFENKWKNYIIEEYKKMKVPNLSDEALQPVVEPYEKKRSYFSVDYCNNASDDNIKNILKEKKYDAIFLDVVFDRGPSKTDFYKVLLALQKNLDRIPPIFVYTGQFQKTLIDIINDGFSRVFGDITPNKYYTIDLFSKTCRFTLMSEYDFSHIEEEREVIRRIISKSKGEVTFSPNQVNDISILHISDLQFGDKKTSKTLNGICHSISSYVGKIDLLIITGDIAMRGNREEFKEGLEFLNLLRDNLWPGLPENEKMERTIVIPGNHDFDLRTTLLDCFDVKNMQDAEGNVIRQLDLDYISKQLNNPNIDLNISNPFGLQAYREFAFRLTHRKEYLYSSLDFVDKRFANWGICFYCLNSVGKITAKETNKVFLEKNSDRLVTPKDTLAIALCHHTFLCEAPFEIPNEDLELFNKTLYGYITGNNCKIIMGGHRHKSSAKDEKLDNKETYHICEAASLRVEGDMEDYIRGYNKYVLTKENDIFTRIKETKYVINESDSSTTSEESEYVIPKYISEE